MFKPLLVLTVCMLFNSGWSRRCFTGHRVRLHDIHPSHGASHRHSGPQLTFRTTDGQEWTLPTTSAELLNGLHKGDTCSLEIDLQDRVVKIVKARSELP